MRLLITSIFCLLPLTMLFGQGTFQSNASAGWHLATTWTLISGSDADGIPDSNDNVIVQSGHNVSISVASSGNNLTLNNGTISFSNTVTLSIAGNLSVTSNSNINGYNNSHVIQVAGNATIPAGITLSVGAIGFTVVGTTTINGSLSLSGYSGKPRNFGDIIINSGGSMTCTGADAYTFNGDLTNNGTFTATSYGTTFAFASSSGTIGGSGLISLFSATFNSPANYTNQGNLQFRNSFSGTGSFTNGNGGQLELQNGGPFSISTFDASAVGNTVTYTGYSNVSAFSGSYYNLVLNKSSGSLTFGGDISIDNDLTIQSGIFQIGAVTADIGGDLIIEGGEFTPDNASGETNLAGDVLMSGGEYDHNNGDVNFNGNVTVSGGAFSMAGSGSTIDVAGTFNHNGGTLQLDAGTLTVPNIYVAAGITFTVGGANVNSTGTAELDGTMVFNATNGTKSYNNIQVNASGTWSVTQDEGFTVSGDITNNGTFNGSPTYGSAIYNLSSTSGTISGSNSLTIRNLLINSPANITNEGVLTVTTTLNGSGTFNNGANATLTYSGNNSSGSNFTITNFYASATGNTVVFNRDGDQQLRATSDSDNNYYNVHINTTAAGNDVTLAGNITIDNQLTLTMGDLFLANNRLTLADNATVSGGSADSFISLNGSGVLRKEYSAVGGSNAFPIGDNNDFSPIISFTVNSATLGSNPYVEFDVTDANHPNRNTDNTGSGGDDEGKTATAYISRYWSINASDMSDPSYTFTAQYIDDDVTGTEANMIGALYRQPVGESFFDWHETGTVNPTNNQVTVTEADNWGDVYAMDNDEDRLPVDLVYFNVAKDGNLVRLEWQTASEENNDYFLVERSQNGVDFHSILSVDGKGNTSGLVNYEANDVQPLNGTSYYRLKQTDFNGQFAYSAIKRVDFGHEELAFEFSLSPNPISAGGRLKINGSLGQQIHNGAHLYIYSRNGSCVYQQALLSEWSEGQLEVELPASLHAGIYIVSIVSGQKRASSKLILH